VKLNTEIDDAQVGLTRRKIISRESPPVTSSDRTQNPVCRVSRPIRSLRPLTKSVTCDEREHISWPRRRSSRYMTTRSLPIFAGLKAGRDGWRQPIGAHRRCLCARSGRHSRAGSCQNGSRTCASQQREASILTSSQGQAERGARVRIGLLTSHRSRLCSLQLPSP
jgi:hypothetical protein